MKNDFDGLISRLDIVEESIWELGNVSIETSKTEKPREKQTKKQRTEYPRTVWQLQRFNTCVIGVPEEGTEETFEAIKTEIPKINLR